MNIVATDIILLFAARIIRLFAYGFISVVLALYLSATGLSASGVGAILSATLAGDILVSLWVTMVADRVGRRNMLLFGATLMILAGLVFLLTTDPVWITLAAIIGIVSPSGGEIGLCLSIEQAALSQLGPDGRREGPPEEQHAPSRLDRREGRGLHLEGPRLPPGRDRGEAAHRPA